MPNTEKLSALAPFLRIREDFSYRFCDHRRSRSFGDSAKAFGKLSASVIKDRHLSRERLTASSRLDWWENMTDHPLRQRRTLCSQGAHHRNSHLSRATNDQDTK
jgi:hypothetical protein